MNDIAPYTEQTPDTSWSSSEASLQAALCSADSGRIDGGGGEGGEGALNIQKCRVNKHALCIICMRISWEFRVSTFLKVLL